MNKEHEKFFHEAGEEARKATCKQALCGAVVVLDSRVVGRGHNAPPGHLEEQCMCNEQFEHSKKPKSDITCCVHAEWAAILDALKHSHNIVGSTLYFTRINESGELVPSGNPYCTVCSRLALESGITFFALWHKDGIRIYDTKEYNKLSYDFHKS